MKGTATSALNEIDKQAISRCENVPGVDLPIKHSVNKPVDPHLILYPNLPLNPPLTSAVVG